MPHLAPPALAVSEQMRNYRRTATAALLALVVGAVVVSALMVLAVTAGDGRSADGGPEQSSVASSIGHPTIVPQPR
jgi:hypothetical protein